MYFSGKKQTTYTTVGTQKISRTPLEEAKKVRETNLAAAQQLRPAKPAVSILIPVFNDGEFLERTIKSIQKQTFKNWEVLILNDGSIDNSAKVALEMAKKDPRIVVIDGPHTGQLAASKNWMAQKARGNFIAQMDGDDLYDNPETLAKQVDYLEENPNTHLVHTAGKRIDVHDKPFAHSKYDEILVPSGVNPKRADTWENLLKHQAITHYQASMARKESWQPIPEVEVNSDQLWYVSVASRHGIDSIKLLPINGFLWRKNPGSITRSPERHAAAIRTTAEGNIFTFQDCNIPLPYQDKKFQSEASSIRYRFLLNDVSAAHSQRWLFAKVLKTALKDPTVLKEDIYYRIFKPYFKSAPEEIKPEK